MTVLDKQLQRYKDLADFWLSSKKAWEYYGDTEAMQKAQNCEKQYQYYLSKIQDLMQEIQSMDAIEITISNQNPLSTQLQRLTGDSWNVHDWEGKLESTPSIIRHRRTGLVVKVF